MKKLLTIIVAMLLIFPSMMNIHAKESEFIIDDNNILVKYTGSSSEVTIPEGVEKIGTDAFFNNKSLRKVSFPKSLKIVGDSAFYQCNNLSEVHMNDGLQEIMGYAFMWCNSIKSIQIPDTVKRIKNCAFEKCINLESIKLSKELNYLGSYIFVDCQKLTNITIPAHLNSFGGSVFRNTNLRYIYFEDGITKIPTNMFGNLETLKQIDVPDTVTVIDGYAFANCKVLKQIVLPSKLESIGEKAFAYNDNLVKITIPETVTNIDKSAFYKSPNVTISAMKGSYAEEFCKEKGLNYIISETPDVPSDVKAYRKTSNIASITWSQDKKADKYQIFVQSEDDTEFKLVKTTTMSNTQINVEPGKKYAIKVRAVAEFDGDTHVSDFSDIRNIAGLAAPTGFKVTRNNYVSLNLEWDSVEGATGYQVYRSITKDGGFNRVKNTTSTSFINKNLETGTRYYYKVRAYYQTDNGRVFSKFTKVKDSKPILNKSSITVTEPVQNLVKIAWKGIAGAEYYQIYYSKNATGKYSLLKTCGPADRSWINTSSDSKSYYYKIRGCRIVNGKKVYSAFSSPKSI